MILRTNVSSQLGLILFQKPRVLPSSLLFCPLARHCILTVFCQAVTTGFSTLYVISSLLLGTGIVQSINLGSIARWLIGRAVVHQWGCATAASRTVCILAKIVRGQHNTYVRLFLFFFCPDFPFLFLSC